MSKKTTASPSASADGVGDTAVAGATQVDLQTTGLDSAQAAGSGVTDAANGGDGGDGGSSERDPGASDQAATNEPSSVVVQDLSVSALEWAASLEYPCSTVIRNNGHITVVEPVTAQIVGGGASVNVTLFDQGHAVTVLDNTLQLNALHFHGELKVRLDAAPDELYLKG